MSTQGWTLDAAHSGIHFSVRHMVISKVRGRFSKFEGSFSLDDKDLSQSSVQVKIDAASIDTGIADRDAHLKSADFLDAEKFPTLDFVSKKIEKVSSDEYRLIGDLTIRGTTKEVPVTVEFGGFGKDPWGNERAGFTAKAQVDRREFGLQWNQVLEAGGVLVGERVDIDIELEVIRPK
ncbi:MAG: YceI family protein [Polyangiaceae bacterium]